MTKPRKLRTRLARRNSSTDCGREIEQSKRKSLNALRRTQSESTRDVKEPNDDSKNHEEHAVANSEVPTSAVDEHFLGEVGFEGLVHARVRIVRVFGRIERLAEQIDEAFAGHAFLPRLPPDAPANRRRFKAYVEQHGEVTRLLSHAVELWMLTCGMKTEDDWTPLVLEEMRRKAQK